MFNEDETYSPLIAQAAKLIRQGGVVAFPTETVYGLGADALNPRAVQRVFEIKGRPWFDPLIVHIASDGQLIQLTTSMTPLASALAMHFWPGPLTLVLPKVPHVPDQVTAGLPTVAVRMPDHPMALDLIRAAGRPIAAPSANPFGMVSPSSAEHVREQLGDRVDLILDGGPCRVGIESTIIAFDHDRPVLLRPGGISLEQINEVIGPVYLPQKESERPQAPGNLRSHYAPRTRLILRGALEPGLAKGKRLGLITMRHAPGQDHEFAVIEDLSPGGDLAEAASRLYHALRHMDKLGLDLIVADLAPEQGIGRGINDRLRRASAPRDDASERD